MELFVYGTLTDPERAREVAADAELRTEARLEGLHRVTGRYPTLAPGGTVRGRILQTAQVAAIDAYEGVNRGLYVRVTVPADVGTVDVYVGNPDQLDLSESIEWPGTGAFADRVETYIQRTGPRVTRLE